ncbi:MAG: hypothetical protein V4555_22065 [Acidobacteriota bacterium]
MSQAQHCGEQVQPDVPKKGKKPPNAGVGRKKGVPNKATGDVRMLIAKFAEKNVGKIDGWLARVAKKNPAKAIDLYCKLIEYHIPKLSRQEIVKPDAGPSRILDSSQLTAEQREQLRLMLAQSDPALLEQQSAHVLQQPGGLGDAQVVDSIEDRTIVSE